MSNKFVLLQSPQVSAQKKLAVKQLITDVTPSEPSSEERKLTVPEKASVLAAGKRSTARRALGRGRRRRTRGGGRVPLIPPPIAENSAARSRIYYTTPAQSSTSVTRGQLGCTPGVVCYATSTNAVALAGSFRLRSVTIWPAAGGECHLYWAQTSAEGVFAKDELKVAPIPTGITATGPIRYTPPPGSTQAMFQAVATNPTDVLFDLVWSAAGCVILVDLEWQVAATFSNYQISVSTGTAGTLYFPALNGASNTLVPVGLPSIH